MAELSQKLALFHSGGIPAQAIILDPSLGVPEYYTLANSEEYREFHEEQLGYFFNFWEGQLLHRLNSLGDVLRNMDPSDRNYPQISKEWRETLKITSPLLEKLAKISKEAEVLGSLTLVIEDEQEV